MESSNVLFSSLQLPDTKRVSDRFNMANAADACWVIGSFLVLCLLISSILIFSAICQHLYCIKALQKNQKKQHIPKWIVHLSSICCSIFGIFCSMAGFSTFIVCTSYQCGYNALGNLYFIINLNSYILSKTFLYILFIARLFCAKEIYNYSRCIQRMLEAVIILIVFTISIITVFVMLIDDHQNNEEVDALDLCAIVAVIVYVIADFILSGATLILFFVPFWKMESNSSKFVILKKYGLISLSQTAISMVYGVSLIVRFVFGWYHTDNVYGISYLDICTVIQSLDIMVTLSCVYIGFVKKEIDATYCAIWKHFLLSFGCCDCMKMNPNKSAQYVVLWDDGLKNRPLNCNDDESEKVFYRERKETIEYQTATALTNSTETFTCTASTLV